MSAITDLYDALVTITDTLFTAPTYRKLVNPYVPERNDALALRRGYGFYVGPSSNANLTMGRYVKYRREIVVIQTIVNRGTERDYAIREAAEKTLLEDQFTLVDYFQQNTTPAAKVWTLEWASDNGIEPVFTDKENYVMIRSTFSAVYAEGC